MKVAICVGHSRRILGRLDGGAVSVDGTSEHEFNSEIAGLLADKLRAYGIKSNIFDSYGGSGYTTAMRDAAEQVRRYNADLAVELHFNAADGRASGFEYLCHHKSAKGHKLADLCLAEHKQAYPLLKSRGVKTLAPDDRGYLFVNYTHCPAVLCEPFFGDNIREWRVYKSDMKKLADTYAAAIYKYFAQ